MARAVWRYIAAHWRGEQSFGWSLWINFAALRLAIELAGRVLSPGEGRDHADVALIAIALGGFFHGVVFIWQTVGLLRAAERLCRDSAGPTPLWGAMGAAIIGFWFALSSAWGVWQGTRPTPVPENFAERKDSEHASRYILAVSPSGDAIGLVGDIALGITKTFERALDENPGVTRVLLASGGGNIYEARGLAKAIRARGLDTQVDATCSSACATVFLAGARRSLGTRGRLGFHRYRIDAAYVVRTDLAGELERDLAQFRADGVSPWFLDRIAATPPDRMWFPSRGALRAAQVITYTP